MVGWNSSIGRHGHLTLETLFVKLIGPPKNINLAGLPKNVVPISRFTTAITCCLPDDSIKREQVVVLPNFAMTDYASQGNTRKYNVVDLDLCYTYHSYYTCLSHSTSAAGTVIVQGLIPKKSQVNYQDF